VQIIVQLGQVARRARVQVQLLGALDEGVELDEGVRPRRRARQKLRAASQGVI
jgi:hypothetical protein